MAAAAAAVAGVGLAPQVGEEEDEMMLVDSEYFLFEEVDRPGNVVNLLLARSNIANNTAGEPQGIPPPPAAAMAEMAQGHDAVAVAPPPPSGLIQAALGGGVAAPDGSVGNSSTALNERLLGPLGSHTPGWRCGDYAILVHYDGHKPLYDEWFPANSLLLAPFRSHTGRPLSLNSLSVKELIKGIAPPSTAQCIPAEDALLQVSLTCPWVSSGKGGGTVIYSVPCTVPLGYLKADLCHLLDLDPRRAAVIRDEHIIDLDVRRGVSSVVELDDRSSLGALGISDGARLSVAVAPALGHPRGAMPCLLVDDDDVANWEWDEER